MRNEYDILPSDTIKSKPLHMKDYETSNQLLYSQLTKEYARKVLCLDLRSPKEKFGDWLEFKWWRIKGFFKRLVPAKKKFGVDLAPECEEPPRAAAAEKEEAK